MSMRSVSSDNQSDHAVAAPTAPTVDINMMISALAMMSSTPFASAQECVDTYLAALPQLIAMRTVYVSQLTSDMSYVIGVQDNAGCPVPVDGSAPLEETFCQYVRASGAPVIVTDAAQDVRVATVLIRELFSIGSYVGVPILFTDGTVYGTLCALDPDPRQFHQMQVDVLRIAARHIGQLLERDTIDRSHQAARSTITVQEDVLDQQTTLLQVVAHDLRTPLSNIQGFAELLTMPHFGPLSVDQHEMVAHIGQSCLFMNRLVNDLVDVAAAERSTLMLVCDTFDPNDVGRQVIHATTQSLSMKAGLHLHLETGADQLTMCGDSARLQQVLLNLISNALRYTQQGQIILRILPEVDVVRFEVADTGPGIAPEQLEHIWERHVRASGVGRGLGLGLYVVRRLVAAMGGTVGVHSTPGIGSTFHICLPIQGPRPTKIQL